jgi:hypothetical protein
MKMLFFHFITYTKIGFMLLKLSLLVIGVVSVVFYQIMFLRTTHLKKIIGSSKNLGAYTSLSSF